MATTIKDVAREAGVAPSTVSYFLNNSAPVSEGARNRIAEAIRKLNYRPNSAARSLIWKRTHQIGLLMPDFVEPENGYYEEDNSIHLFRGVCGPLKKCGYRMVIAWNSENEVETIIADKSMDGLLYISPHVDDRGPLLMRDHKFPFVLLGRSTQLEQYHSVDIDNINAAQAATQYLIQLGHTRIAFITPCELDLMLSSDRLTGYQMAMLSKRLPIVEEYVKVGNELMETGYRLANELLDLPEPPTAIFAARDVLALGVRKAVVERGFRVPDDVAIIGFDNSRIAAMEGITSIDTPIHHIGAEAAKLLIEIINNPTTPYKKIVIPTQIVVRSSTAPESGSQAT